MGHIAWAQASNLGQAPCRAKLGLIFGYGSLAMIPVIAALAGLTAPLVIRQREKADQVEYIRNMRQVGAALFSYRGKYGSYPPDLALLETEGLNRPLNELLEVRSSAAGDWLYYPKATIDDAKNVLLITPLIQHGKQALVLRVDASIQTHAKWNLPSDLEAIRIPAP